MGRFLKTAGFYLLVGPPIGGVTLILIWSIFGGESSAGRAVWTFLAGLLFAVPLSYIFGGLQALFVGLVSAVWEKTKGATPAFVPAIASVVAFGVMDLVASGGSSDAAPAQMQQGALVMLVTHAVAGLGPWWLLRKIRKEGSA